MCTINSCEPMWAHSTPLKKNPCPTEKCILVEWEKQHASYVYSVSDTKKCYGGKKIERLGSWVDGVG